MHLNRDSVFILFQFLKIVQAAPPIENLPKKIVILPRIPEEPIACKEGSALHQIVNSVLDEVAGKILFPKTVPESPNSQASTSTGSSKNIFHRLSCKAMLDQDVFSPNKKIVDKPPTHEELVVNQIPRKYSKLINNGVYLISGTFTRVSLFIVNNYESKNAGMELIHADLPFPPDIITKIDIIFRKIREIRQTYRENMISALKKNSGRTTRSTTENQPNAIFEFSPRSIEFHTTIRDFISHSFSEKIHYLIDNQQRDHLNDLSRQIAKYTSRPRALRQ
ncbi:hypothetical protein MJO28_005142 [Puccinia striiformis f. sp. tritici]|uniref:Uncharacterized protein n=4 Tax=Puccinia striiformis TaxID=27350 RepID=A0A0L0UWS5_9BASI|nr:hypothetical protein Pst134EA_009308 [Puccinia striiformis f. sp. tritici]KAI9622383.1 hypothetical protein KEM48_007274 [Puccinia striiformis f. sp. tritici PST-130]KNE91204.1 hypothetical protein PSTG_15368 [Puccinia striiformis f. sp. tritici PST-78]POW15743.1 hypothetical protein PSTT_01916 [Puccinia striiformis]KAH9458080.1 hypothetical protein Pst134EB_010383 [Puccinia striiformis f. sp. tritici]KAH9468776.1 hypothetical protein Pst134EA_009308 [Puccinia striiformis f. sp. tritici]